MSYLSSRVHIRMPLTKQCMLCGAVVNVKKSVCVCGYNFALKRKALVKSTNSQQIAYIIHVHVCTHALPTTMKQKRASESIAERVLRRTRDI